MKPSSGSSLESLGLFGAIRGEVVNGLAVFFTPVVAVGKLMAAAISSSPPVHRKTTHRHYGDAEVNAVAHVVEEVVFVRMDDPANGQPHDLGNKGPAASDRMTERHSV